MQILTLQIISQAFQLTGYFCESLTVLSDHVFNLLNCFFFIVYTSENVTTLHY